MRNERKRLSVCLSVLVNSYPIAEHSREKARALRKSASFEKKDEISDHAINISLRVVINYNRAGHDAEFRKSGHYGRVGIPNFPRISIVLIFFFHNRIQPKWYFQTVRKFETSRRYCIGIDVPSDWSTPYLLPTRTMKMADRRLELMMLCSFMFVVKGRNCLSFYHKRAESVIPCR